MQIIIDMDERDYADIMSDSPRNLDYYERMIKRGTPIPKGHGRLIDADALADRIQEVSVIQRYEDIKIERRCTVADVLTSLTHDLRGTALCGYELCPTIVEADGAEE